MDFLCQAALEGTILLKEFLLLASLAFLSCSLCRHSKVGQGVWEHKVERSWLNWYRRLNTKGITAKENFCSNEQIHKRGHMPWVVRNKRTLEVWGEKNPEQLVSVTCNYNGLVLLKKILFIIPGILTVIVPEKLVFSSFEQYHIQLCLGKFKSPALTTLTLLNKTIEHIVITMDCVFFFLCREHILWTVSLIRTWYLGFIHIWAFNYVCIFKRRCSVPLTSLIPPIYTTF